MNTNINIINEKKRHVKNKDSSQWHDSLSIPSDAQNIKNEKGAHE